MIKLDKNLKLVIPVLGDPIESTDPETGEAVSRAVVRAYVHAAPIGPETWDAYFLEISTAFRALYEHGLNWSIGPRVAAKMLKKVAQDSKTWENGDGRVGVREGLFGEMTRLSNVLVAGKDGWETFSMNQAVDQKLLDADEVQEVENQIAFFTLAWWMHTRTERGPVVREAARFSGSLTTSFNPTEFVASLRTSTAPANTGERAGPSPIPR